MKLTAHQPACWPWLGLLDKIRQAEGFVLFDAVPCSGKGDGGFEARNRILTSRGEQWLSVPVQRGRDLPLSEVRIVKTQPWRRKHLRAIEQAYRRAPYFNSVYPVVEETYSRDWDLLVDFDWHTTSWLLERFHIIPEHVWRLSRLGLNGLRKQDLVLGMCKAVGASEYLFGPLGRDYAEPELFEASGVRVSFQEFRHPEYTQVGGGGFVPGLSALDYVMNCGFRPWW